MKTIISLLAITMLSACENKPIEESKAGNFTIELLFEKNGCKVYRFQDGARFIYWSDCTGKMEYKSTTHNGKYTSTYRMESLTN